MRFGGVPAARPAHRGSADAAGWRAGVPAGASEVRARYWMARAEPASH